MLQPLAWRERFWRMFFPARCLKCGKAVASQRLFCGECAQDLPEAPILREFPLPGESRWLEVAAPLPYEEGFRRTLHRLKFSEERYLAEPLGLLMAEAAQAFSRPMDGVVWVPMSSKKLRQRGYNQSQLLAQQAAKAMGLPAWELLSQVQETRAQHQLSRRERADNVRDAYRAAPGALGKNLLLVDDIVTTGATLRSCALALYQAGAKGVWGICAASTPLRPGDELPGDQEEKEG